MLKTKKKKIKKKKKKKKKKKNEKKIEFLNLKNIYLKIFNSYLQNIQFIITKIKLLK